jgi:hypothetical protein
MNSNGELIRRVRCQTLRNRWIIPLSAAIAVDPRTVCRWAAGQRQPPVAILQMLQDFVRERIKQLAAELKTTQHDQNLAK